MLEASERLQRCPRILSTESGGEAIVARLSDGCFFGLGEIGTLVWARLAQPGAASEVMEFLQTQCDPLPESAAVEVGAFLEELRREGLIEAVPASAELPNPQFPAEPTTNKHQYAAPRLDRGTLRRAAFGDITYYDGGTTTSGGPGGVS